MKGRTPLSASLMAANKIRPAAIKVVVRLEHGQRFGFHNFRYFWVARQNEAARRRTLRVR